VGKRRVNFQRCWLPVSRIGLHRRGVERVNCGPKLLDLGEKGVYSSYTYSPEIWEGQRKRVPLKRFGEGSEVADAIAFLASERASYITEQTLIVDGGLRL